MPLNKDEAKWRHLWQDIGHQCEHELLNKYDQENCKELSKFYIFCRRAYSLPETCKIQGIIYDQSWKITHRISNASELPISSLYLSSETFIPEIEIYTIATKSQCIKLKFDT